MTPDTLPKPKMVSQLQIPATTTPQQNSWTTQSFANAIRNKYPDGIASDGTPYKEMTDDELTKRVVAKYPVYQNQITDYNKASLHKAAQNLEQLPKQVTDISKKVTEGLGLTGATDTIGQNLATIFNILNPTTSEEQKMKIQEALNQPDLPENIKRSIGAGLQIAPYVAAPGAGAAAEAPVGVGKGIIAGAKVGAKAGATFGAMEGAGGTLDTGGTIGEAAGNALQGGLEGAAGGAVLGGIGGGIGGGLKAYKEYTQPEQVAIDAVNPQLKGKAKIAAYKEIATGKRQVQPAKAFSIQSLEPTPQQKALGLRLAPQLQERDPLKNLISLGKEMQNTEEKITTALAGDPSLQFNADKPSLAAKIDEAVTQMPREYQSIRDSKSTYENVMGFAKNLVAKADDTIAGIRDARISFDRQAQKEYPSAFKEGGYIDLKTPAGRAIKTARDLFNEHLYETAPNGSEIKNLIQHEADIFRAADIIGPKASEMHGYTKLESAAKYFKGHPIVAGAGAGLLLTGALLYGKEAAAATVHALGE